MRGINLLPKIQSYNKTAVAARRWALNASIFLIVFLATASVAVFLLDLFFKGSIRQVQQIVTVKEEEVKALSTVEGLQFALKRRASSLASLKKKQIDYKPTIDIVSYMIGAEGALQDLALDGNKLSISFTATTSDGLVAVFNRLTTEAMLQKLSHVTLVSLAKDESVGWRVTFTAEVR